MLPTTIGWIGVGLSISSSPSASTCAKAAYQRSEVLPAPALFTQQMQAGERGMGNGRRLAGGIDVGPGKLDQGFDQLLAAGDKAPAVPNALPRVPASTGTCSMDRP